MPGVARSRREQGAAAVEFALVAPVLFLILFGIIDYGLYFSDALSVRQAAAEAARTASLWSLDDSTTPPWGTTVPASCDGWEVTSPSSPSPALQVSPALQALGCAAATAVHPLAGTVYAKIEILDQSELTVATTSPLQGPGDWAAPHAVRICLLQVHTSVTGFLPIPGTIAARATMPLEGTVLSSAASAVQLVGGQQQLPSGLSWSTWCP